MCNCIEEVNKGLADRNSVLAEMTLLNFETGAHRQSLIVATEKIGPSRKSAIKVVPTFCPFCGEKIKTTKDFAEAYHD